MPGVEGETHVNDVFPERNFRKVHFLSLLIEFRLSLCGKARTDNLARLRLLTIHTVLLGSFYIYVQ